MIKALRSRAGLLAASMTLVATSAFAHCPDGQIFDQASNQCIPDPHLQQQQQQPVQQMTTTTEPMVVETPVVQPAVVQPVSPLVNMPTPNVIPTDSTPFTNPVSLGQNMTPAEVYMGTTIGAPGGGQPPVDIDANLIESREQLLDPHQDLSLNIHDSQIDIQAGSRVLVVESNRTVGVYDLHDKRKGAVTVTAASKKFTLLPGQQLIITQLKTDDFDAINPHAGIGYRNMSMIHSTDQESVYHGEFSIISALQCSRPLAAMSKSTAAPKVAYVRELIRNAVILHTLNNDRKPYQNSYQALVARGEWPRQSTMRIAKASH